MAFHPRAECFVGEVERQGPVAVFAACDYGVSSHGKGPAALVHFYAKRYAADPDQWSKLDGAGDVCPIEIGAAIADGELTLTVLREGKPAADVDLIVQAPGESMARLKSDADGRVVRRLDKSGAYGAFAMTSSPESGERDGKSYGVVRRIASLSFDVPASAVPPSPWAEGATPKAETSDALVADPAAAAALGKALASQSMWGDDFPGFSAKLDATLQGLRIGGDVSITGSGEVKVAIEPDHPEARRRATEFLESLAWHRARRNVGEAKSHVSNRMSTEVAFARADHAPTARGVELAPIDDPFGSRFFVKEGRLAAAARVMGDRKQSISILASELRDDGRAIPTELSVAFWDLNDQLTGVETESRSWVDVGGHALPARVVVVKAESKNPFNRRNALPGGEGHWETLEMTFSNHVLARP